MKRKPSRKRCHKVEYRSPEEARQALKDHGRARGCRSFYRCRFHGNREAWHLTSAGRRR